MRLVLYGLSAYRYWMRAPDRPPARLVSDRRVLQGAAPTLKSLAYLEATLPDLAPPFHVCCINNSRRCTEDTFAHRTGQPYPDESFLPVADGLYASSPELTAAQLSVKCHGPLLAKALCMLLGSYVKAPTTRYGMSTRRPLTTRAAMAATFRAIPRLPGASEVKSLLPYVAEGLASPAEADLYLALCLPCRRGGLGLPQALANRRIPLSSAAQRLAGQSFVRADLLWPMARLVVEYDSDLTHLTSQQHALDAARRAALEADGFRVITVTAEHLYGPRGLGAVAELIAKLTGHRLSSGAYHARVTDGHPAALDCLPRGYDLPSSLFS